MKPKDRLLTYEQARELKWFCRNVVGTREEYYKVFEMAHGFNARLNRMEKTCALIEKFLGEEIKSLYEDDFARTFSAPTEGELKSE